MAAKRPVPGEYSESIPHSGREMPVLGEIRKFCASNEFHGEWNYELHRSSNVEK